MKGMELPVNKTFGMGIFILVAIAVVFAVAVMIPKALGGVNDSKQYTIEQAKIQQLKDLNGFYDTFKKTDGGFDSYEASVLLAKVIEYTWSDCANFCEKKMDIADFTNFFITHPITLSKTLDCDTPYIYDKDTEHKISKNRISGFCKTDDIDADKNEIVDEWTTTIWGLRQNSDMCTKYMADGYHWGNMYCGSAEYTDYIVTPSYFIEEGKRCTPLCGTGKDWVREITQDRIKGWEGKMEAGKAYNNIKIFYDPDCTYAKGFLPFSDQACLEVEIGSSVDMTPTMITNFQVVPAAPKKGDVVAFSGFLKNQTALQNNEPIEKTALSGKTVKLVGFDISGKELGVIKSDATDEYGMFYIYFPISQCGAFKARAKFGGEGIFKETETQDITVAPSGCSGAGSGGAPAQTGGTPPSGGSSSSQCPVGSSADGYYFCTDSDTCSSNGNCIISGKSCAGSGFVCCKEKPC